MAAFGHAQGYIGGTMTPPPAGVMPVRIRTPSGKTALFYASALGSGVAPHTMSAPAPAQALSQCLAGQAVGYAKGPPEQPSLHALYAGTTLAPGQSNAQNSQATPAPATSEPIGNGGGGEEPATETDVNAQRYDEDTLPDLAPNVDDCVATGLAQEHDAEVNVQNCNVDVEYFSQAGTLEVASVHGASTIPSIGTNCAAIAAGGSLELRVGDIVYRHGELASIVLVDRELEPPSYVVRMARTGQEVSCEQEHLTRAFSSPCQEQHCLQVPQHVSQEVANCNQAPPAFADLVQMQYMQNMGLYQAQFTQPAQQLHQMQQEQCVHNVHHGQVLPHQHPWAQQGHVHSGLPHDLSHLSGEQMQQFYQAQLAQELSHSVPPPVQRYADEAHMQSMMMATASYDQNPYAAPSCMAPSAGHVKNHALEALTEALDRAEVNMLVGGRNHSRKNLALGDEDISFAMPFDGFAGHAPSSSSTNFALQAVSAALGQSEDAPGRGRTVSSKLPMRFADDDDIPPLKQRAAVAHLGPDLGQVRAGSNTSEGLPFDSTVPRASSSRHRDDSDGCDGHGACSETEPRGRPRAGRGEVGDGGEGDVGRGHANREQAPHACNLFVEDRAGVGEVRLERGVLQGSASSMASVQSLPSPQRHPSGGDLASPIAPQLTAVSSGSTLRSERDNGAPSHRYEQSEPLEDDEDEELEIRARAEMDDDDFVPFDLNAGPPGGRTARLGPSTRPPPLGGLPQPAAPSAAHQVAPPPPAARGGGARGMYQRPSATGRRPPSASRRPPSAGRRPPSVEIASGVVAAKGASRSKQGVPAASRHKLEKRDILLQFILNEEAPPPSRTVTPVKCAPATATGGAPTPRGTRSRSTPPLGAQRPCATQGVQSQPAPPEEVPAAGHAATRTPRTATGAPCSDGKAQQASSIILPSLPQLGKRPGRSQKLSAVAGSGTQSARSWRQKSYNIYT